MINRRFKANRPKVVGNTNITPYWQVIKDIIDQSDIILEVIDARMPELSRNKELEEIVIQKNKELIFILNKIDLTEKSSLNKKYNKLKKESHCFIISSVEKIGTKRLREYLIVKAKEIKKNDDRAELKIGVLGYPNTGKSSIINALAMRSKTKVSSKAGTTHGPQWINIWENIKLIDSPGVIPLNQNDEVRNSLIASKNPEKIHDLEIVAHNVIKLFDRKESLAKFYKIIIPENLKNNPDEIINLIGQKKGFIKKHALIDVNRTCIQIIRDWQRGNLRL